MKGGDLSNVSPARCLVTLDVLTAGRYLPKKRAWKSWARIAQDTPLEVLVNGALWQISNRSHLTFEAVVFGLPSEYVDALGMRFDEEGWIIRYASEYESRHALQRTLAYRPDVVRVIDTNAFTWGSRGVTLEEALRG